MPSYIDIIAGVLRGDPRDGSGGDSGTGGGTDGGGGTGTGVTVNKTPSIDEFVTDEGGVLAEAFGEHLVAGHLIVHKYVEGPPPDSIFIVAHGEGEWDSVVKVWYAGEELASSPDGTTAGYHFHPGTISTGIADTVQGVDSFLPDGLAYSGTAYSAIKLPEEFAVEDRPDKLRGRYKCKKTWDYDSQGNPTTVGYSANPARVAADRIKRYFDQRFDDSTLAAARFRARINWPLWTAWRDFNDALITWNDGTTVDRQIKRFECHVVFTTDIILADALDAICATCATWWQDDGEQIRFLTPEDRDPVHHFDLENIVSGSFQVLPQDIRERPNYFIAKFRDLDSEFLSEASVEVKKDSLIRRVGKNYTQRAFPNMVYSQAQRLLERQARIEAENTTLATLRGFGDALHVLPGDYVTVSHPVSNWVYQKCLVLDVSIDSGEKTADEIEFTLEKIDGTLYFDTDHKPIQPSVDP